jgi:hypothetical protein
MFGTKFFTAGAAAFLVFLASYVLLMLFEEPFRNLMGWQELNLIWDTRWWRIAAGLTLAAYVFRLVIVWRNKAALEWRKTLAGRARA